MTEPGFLKPPPAFPGMRIGLLGGSFNPAHRGHLHISRMVLARLRLHRLWWLVTPGNPLKGGRELKPLDQRLEAAVRAARHPRIAVTGFEAARPDAYTVNTLQFLVTHFPGTRFVWIMGADGLASFHRWRDWRRLAALAPMAVLDRPGYRFAALASPAGRALAHARIDESDAAGLTQICPPAWAFLTIPLSPVSSTEIRARGTVS